MQNRLISVGALALSLAFTACDDAESLLAPGSARPVANKTLVELDSSIRYSITLTSSAYDAAKDQTTYTYQVTSKLENSSADVSHWTLHFPFQCDGKISPLVVSTSEAYECVNTDPTTGLWGIKFDKGYNGDSRTVALTLEGAWTDGPVAIAVKAGNGRAEGKVTGPRSQGAAGSQSYSITGLVFLDIDGDGARDAGEPGIADVAVAVSTDPVKTTTTDADGGYLVTGLANGTYQVTRSGIAGLLPAGAVTREVEIDGADASAEFALRLDLAGFAGKAANGLSHGFWKSNIDKAIKGQTRGVQVSKATLEEYLGQEGVSGFALEPFNPITLKDASAVLSFQGSSAVDLLRKQLIASELNYFNGGYIDGSEVLTRLFVWQGEFMVQNSPQYSAAQLLAMKDWLDAYNNTHGGALVAPAAQP